MHKFILSSTIVIALLGVGCGHQVVKYGAAATQTSEVQPGVGGLEVHVHWIKIKGDKIDMELGVANTSNGFIKLSYNSLQLKYNGETALLNPHGNFMENLGIVGPHNVEKGYVYFTFSHKLAKQGTAVLTVDPVYAAPSADATKEAWQKLQPNTFQLPVN